MSQVEKDKCLCIYERSISVRTTFILKTNLNKPFGYPNVFIILIV